jgi:hypothetical protein
LPYTTQSTCSSFVANFPKCWQNFMLFCYLRELFDWYTLCKAPAVFPTSGKILILFCNSRWSIWPFKTSHALLCSSLLPASVTATQQFHCCREKYSTSGHAQAGSSLSATMSHICFCPRMFWSYHTNILKITRWGRGGGGEIIYIYIYYTHTRYVLTLQRVDMSQ